MPTSHPEQADAARILRAVLDRVERAELDASPVVAARLTGATLALEAATRPRTRSTPRLCPRCAAALSGACRPCRPRAATSARRRAPRAPVTFPPSRAAAGAPSVDGGEPHRRGPPFAARDRADPGGILRLLSSGIDRRVAHPSSALTARHPRRITSAPNLEKLTLAAPSVASSVCRAVRCGI